MCHGDYYDAPLGMSNAIKGKKTLSIFDFTMRRKPKVCFLTPTRKKGVKLTQIQVKEFKVKLIFTN
jgi:hypothetical protein